MRASNLVNLALYQAGWLAIVLGAASGHPWIGSVAALGLVGAHLALVSDPVGEGRLLGFAALMGAAMDSFLAAARLVAYPEGQTVAWLAPAWDLLLWAQFATLLHFALAWLRRRWGLAALLGAVGGPLAFAAGEGLGAVVLPMGAISLAALSIAWASAMPALLGLAEINGRFGEGYRRPGVRPGPLGPRRLPANRAEPRDSV